MRYLPAFTFLAVVGAAVLGTAARGAAPAAASPNIFYSLPAGESPAGALLQGQDGNIYGATATGGTNNSGAIFEVTLGGRMTNLFSFDGTNGSAPLAGPIQDSAGNLYGTASSGGPAGKGTIYRISPGGGITLLAAFNGTNGANPSASLMLGTNGWYYGTTLNGGSNGLGGIFRVNESGVLSNVYSFAGTNGANPGGGLVAGADGNVYGTTGYGGSTGAGTIFRLTYAGALTTLASFSDSTGSVPGGLVEDGSGNFYGATMNGGTNLAGTIFEWNSQKKLQTLFSIGLTNGSNPNSPLVLGSDGNLYGTALQGGPDGLGNVFSFTPSGGSSSNGPSAGGPSPGGSSGGFNNLFSFTTTNGAYPKAPLVLGMDGNLYGTTSGGGAGKSGEIFQLAGFGPHIATEPATQKWTTNGAAIFSVSAGGSAPLSYQWLFDGSAIAGATNSSYEVRPEELANVGSYSVIVSNASGSVTSSVAQLSLPLPTVAIKTPPATVTNPTLTISGTAADRYGLRMVQYQLNNATNWLTALGSNEWSAEVTLKPGSNVFAARSADLFTNFSTVKKVNVFYSTSSPLTLKTSGAGAISHGFKGTNLIVGRSYTVRAAPGAGLVFSNWSGTNWLGTIPATNNPLTFIMQSNMVLQANFVPNPFTAVTGAYNGLFYDTNGVAAESAGLLSGLVVGKMGTYSGALILAGTRYGLSGAFDVEGNASHAITRSQSKGGSLVVDLTLDLTITPPQLTGTVSNRAWTATLFAERASNTLESAEYTLLIPPATNAPTGSPPGYGYALLTNHHGTVTLGGSVADGAAFSRSVAVAGTGDVPLYASLYGNTGLLFGWLTLTNGGLTGSNLWWFRPASSGAKPVSYTAGFTNEAAVLGSPWTNQPIALSNAQLQAADGNLTRTLTFTVDLAKGLLSSATNAPTNSLSGSVNQKTGLLKVTFGDGNGRQTLAGKGAFLQNTNFGGGFFTNNASDGTITLESASP